MLNSCLFAIAIAEPSLREVVSSRVDRLAGFYAPLGALEPTVTWLSGERAAVGSIPFAAPVPQSDQALWWGGRPGDAPTSASLLEAGDAELRRVEPALAVLACHGGVARFLTGPSPPTAAYDADSGAVRAWCTHAVGAAWLALGIATIDPDSLVELIAADFVGSNGSLILGAAPVEPATVVDLGPEGAAERSYWPSAKRLGPLPELEASANCERELLASLERRVAAFSAPRLGLTGGLDSRVIAVALGELGVPFEAFTWGEPDSDDVVGAGRAAAAIGAAHVHVELDWYTENGWSREVDATARWSDGSAPLGPGRPRFPSPLDAWVTGSGGETGRAFYYGRSGRLDERPSERVLHATLHASLSARLAEADPEAALRLRGRVAEWVSDARASGHDGWRCLDVVYAEQRLANWGRGMMPTGAAPMIFGFASPGVLRALISMPLEDRLNDAFHRRFLERHARRVAPAAEAGFASRRRRGAGALSAPRDLARALGLRRRIAPPPPTRVFMSDHPNLVPPSFLNWLRDEVLASPLTDRALGDAWGRRVAEGFEHDGRLESIAVAAAGPVALGDALRESGLAMGDG